MKQRHGAFADVGLASLRIPLIKYSLDFPIFPPHLAHCPLSYTPLTYLWHLLHC